MPTYARTLRRAAAAAAAFTTALLPVTAACQQAPSPGALATTESVIAIQHTSVTLVSHGRVGGDARRAETHVEDAAALNASKGRGQGQRAGGRQIVLLNVHDDESTSVDAALDVLQTPRLRGPARGAVEQARLHELRHTGARNLIVRDEKGDSVAIDPNRMFTDAGAWASMARLGRADSVAFRAVRAFADTLLRRTGLDTAGVVVTLHNNTEANYSARSYEAGATYATDAAAVTLHPDRDADDFFFVTDRTLYDALRRRGFNVVLQDNARVTDDGSLSVLAARRGQLYVNVEAQHGHRREQAEMLRVLFEVLAASPAR